MARPRIFVSSTYYDFKYIRASVEIFIQSLGYDAILSEKGDIAYLPDSPLDESCYREVQNSEIYVLIIGGRYGSEASSKKTAANKTFFDKYESITKIEYKSAVDKDIPVYVLIEKAVYVEYQTFRNNRDNKTIKYAHVDSVNIFYFIEEILSQPRNNPMQTFERHSEIEEWLREQWSGLFREMIQKRSSQKQLSSLSAQVLELSEMNTTLKRYLEELLKSGGKSDKSEKLINEEEKRLETKRAVISLSENNLVSYLYRTFGIEYADSLVELQKSKEDFPEFLKNVEKHVTITDNPNRPQLESLITYPEASFDYKNALKNVLGMNVTFTNEELQSSRKRNNGEREIKNELESSKNKTERNAR